MTGRLTAALIRPARCATLVSQVSGKIECRCDGLQFTMALPLRKTRLSLRPDKRLEPSVYRRGRDERATVGDTNRNVVSCGISKEGIRISMSVHWPNDHKHRHGNNDYEKR
jgi:hypothetical protein